MNYIPDGYTWHDLYPPDEGDDNYDTHVSRLSLEAAPTGRTAEQIVDGVRDLLGDLVGVDWDSDQAVSLEELALRVRVRYAPEES